MARAGVNLRVAFVVFPMSHFIVFRHFLLS